MGSTRGTDARRRALLAGLGGGVLLARNARAQEAAWPARPVKIVVGFAPGGGSDFIARLVAQKLTARLGKPVIVENKPGAGGLLGAEQALRAPGDGYTLFLAAGSYTVAPALYKLSFDPIEDMTPIAQLARGPFIVAVHPAAGLDTLAALVARARQSPGRLAYASAGTGSVTQMVTEYFLETAGIEVLHVPYKGTSPALTDTIAGQTQLLFGTVSSTLHAVKAGQLRAIAVTTPARLAALPDVPTIAESGWTSFKVTNWHGLIGPKGIPPAIVTTLNQAVREAMGAGGMDTQLASDGLSAAAGTPESFGALLREEIARWGAVARSRGVKV